MADIIKFPDISDRNGLEVRAAVAAQFVRRGVAGGLAKKLSAEIEDDFRYFERKLASMSSSFNTTTDAEVLLVKDATLQVTDAIKPLWLAQRFESELRRLGKG